MRTFYKLTKSLVFVSTTWTLCFAQTGHAANGTVEDLPSVELAEILRDLAQGGSASASEAPQLERIKETFSTKRLLLNVEQLRTLADLPQDIRQSILRISIRDQGLHVTDQAFSKVANFENLVDLSVESSLPTITSLDPVSHLSRLQRLLVRSSDISDLSPLQNLPELTELDISGNLKVTDFSPLQHLTQLRKLYLRGNKGLPDLNPLKRLERLEVLDISSTKIEDLRPIENLSQLKELHMRDAKRIISLRPLRNLKNLETLDASFTGVSNLRPLEELPRLKMLDVFRTQVNLHDIRELREKTPNIQVVY
jgi:hypothetical protein